MAVTYLPFLDGLRAFSVIIVVCFHLDLIGFEGGFVGVDIFFLISGFIVTHVQLPSVRTGTFSFPDFYLRRAKRLLPELYLLMFSTLLAGLLILSKEALKRMAISALAQTFFSANVRYWLESENYFGTESRGKPLMHTWSLSVEEQYYFSFPLVVMLIQSGMGRKWKFAIFISVFCASLTLYLLAQEALSNFVFFLLPARVWEFALGVMLAVYREELTEQLFNRFEGRHMRNILGVASATLLLASLIWHQNLSVIYTPLVLLIPVGASAILIAVSFPEEDSEPIIIATILSAPPIVYIGKLSYSIYLWHWPIICIAQSLFAETGPSKPLVFLGIISITAALSVVSYHLVGTPIRAIPTKEVTASKGRILLSLAPLFSFMLVCIGIIAHESLLYSLRSL